MSPPWRGGYSGTPRRDTVKNTALEIHILRQRYAKELILRTSAFSSFCAGKPDEDRLPAFLDTLVGRIIAARANWPAPKRRPVWHYYNQDLSQLHLIIDLDFPKQEIRDILQSSGLVQLAATSHEYDPFLHRLRITFDLTIALSGAIIAARTERVQKLVNKHHRRLPRRKREGGILSLKDLAELFRQYDAVKANGGNVLRAMHVLYPDTVGLLPSEDKEVARIYKQVERAYKKISREIRELEAGTDFFLAN